MRFEHIAIVGVGLIGGSFALAARRAGIAQRITGWDREPALAEALDRGVIDGVETAFDSGNVSSADLVYLAAPVGAISGFLRSHGNSIKPGTVVTDAGSTKREICRVAREALGSEVDFVGGHPMAGSERTGVACADADLFKGAAYALVTPDRTSSDAMRAVTELVRRIGARPIVVTAEEHDRIAARISHVPQMLSTALALAVSRSSDAGALKLAGSGLVEMTRLAESRWSMWQDICRTNADEIASALDETIAEIEAVRSAISSGDLSGLSEMFTAAGALASRFQSQDKQGAD